MPGMVVFSLAHALSSKVLNTCASSGMGVSEANEGGACRAVGL